jgi:hypothetical protein
MTIINKSIHFSLVFILSFSFCCKYDVNDRKVWASFLNQEAIPRNAKKLKLIESVPAIKTPPDINHLANPAYMLFGNDNSIFVTDVQERALLELDSSGRLKRRIGNNGQGPGDLVQPLNIGSDAHQNIYVFDGGNPKILVLNSNGDFVRSFKVFKPCFSMDVDEEGIIYLALFENYSQAGLISIYDSYGKYLGQMGSRLEAGSPGSFNNIDICALKDGLYVAWKTYPLVRRYTKTGELVFEHHLSYGLMKEFGDLNRKATIKKGRIPVIGVINRIRAFSGGYYLLRTYPRLEIIKIGISGELLDIYWDNTPYGYFASDFLVIPTNDGIRIYILGTFPDPGIYIYGEDEETPKKK